jgi:hypothetical protein
MDYFSAIWFNISIFLFRKLINRQFKNKKLLIFIRAKKIMNHIVTINLFPKHKLR